MRLASVFLYLVFFCTSLFAQDIPTLTSRVTDMSGVLSTQEVAFLEQNLMQYEKETSTQIAILIVPSIEWGSLEDFSMKVVESWQIGQDTKDNGVLLLISIGDRKIRLEIGYGLEGDLTDAESARIIRNKIAPAFKRQQYFEGVESGVESIKTAIVSDFTIGSSVKSDWAGFLPMLIMALVFLLSSEALIGYFMFMPFFAMMCFEGGVTNVGVYFFSAYVFVFPLLRLLLKRIGFYEKFANSQDNQVYRSTNHHDGFGGGYGGGSGGFRGGGGFSGGGGGFGGGGASGGW